MIPIFSFSVWQRLNRGDELTVSRAELKEGPNSCTGNTKEKEQERRETQRKRAQGLKLEMLSAKLSFIFKEIN